MDARDLKYFLGGKLFARRIAAFTKARLARTRVGRLQTMAPE
jgi:hypothetical protein